MQPSNDDDFSNLLDFGFQFPDLDGRAPGDQFQPMSSAAPDNAYRMTDSFSVDAFNTNGQSSGQIPPTYSNADIAPGFYQDPAQNQQLNGQQFQQHQLLQRQLHQAPHQSNGQYGHTVIPPTPNSIELQGAAARYPHRLDESHDLYGRYARANDEQAFYTPLISPAMTPLETQFRLPEYTIPGEYFTPLSSPAIEAQNAHPSGIPLRSQADVGYLQSPAGNSLPGSSAPSSPAITRKHRRRTSASNKVTGRAKKSPAVRPQPRKKSLLNLNSNEMLNGLSQTQNTQPQVNGNGVPRHSSNESTADDSISPEPLSDPLMPPPSLPPPRKSPAVGPQMSQGEAATPATLMRISRSEESQSQASQSPAQTKPAGESHDDIMEDVALPEAATPAAHLYRPKPGRIDTTSHSNAASPTTPGNGTPSLQPNSAPVDRPASSVAPSPRTIAMPSPSGPTGKKPEARKTGASSKKRQSVSSTQPSPQLRPKISPSIQPLSRANNGSSGNRPCSNTKTQAKSLPGMTNDTSAHYLASKSNYQHILDGTHLPGVTYPETLAENLTSKRTNHKLAEQGRRNRINNALKEIETLIPQDFANARTAKEAADRGIKPADKEKEKAASSAVSKASAVEMAIEYIKALQGDLEDTKGKLVIAEGRLAGNDSKTG